MNPKHLIGKTIATVNMRPFNAELYSVRGKDLREGQGRQAHDPLIVFTDGSSIRFVTEETETGIYGTDIVYVPAPKKVRK